MSRESEHTIDAPRQSRAASVVPGSIDVERRTVDLIWTTGARVMRGYFDRFWEELSLSTKHVRLRRLNNGAPLLNAHDDSNAAGVIGVVESKSARIDGDKGIATVRFARAEDDPIADQIFRKVADGIIQNVSVGYSVYRMEKVEDSADKIPVFRAVDWEPFEISVVPMGADDGAGFRSASVTENNPCVFVTRTIQESTMPDPVLPAPDLAPAPAPAPAPVPAPSLSESTRAAVEAERVRAREIYDLAKRHKLGPEWSATLIGNGATVDEARTAVLDVLAARDAASAPVEGHIRVTPGEDETEKWRRGATAWLITRCGSHVVNKVREAAQATGVKVDLDPGEYRGMRLIDLARESLTRRGISHRGKSAMEIAQLALRGGSYNGTSDFPVLLQEALHKIVLSAYAVTPDRWTSFCKIGTVSDFRDHHRLRKGSFGRLDPVGEGGEFKNKAIPDGTDQTISASTVGNIIAITRETIVNDDMGAFQDLAVELGAAARLTIELDVFDALAENGGLGPTMSDGKTLFHADHGNIGSPAVLSAASLEADRAQMTYQTDPSGNYKLDISPTILLVPSTLSGAANSINSSEYDPDAAANKAQNKRNLAYNMYKTIVGTARLASGSTRRYSFAAPDVLPTIEVVFLDGVQEPQFETFEDPRINGVSWRVRMDFGVGAVDYRGAITNAGA